MKLRPPIPKRTDTLFPSTTLFRSWSQSCPKGYRSFRTDLFGFVGFLRFQDFEDERDGLIYRERCLRVVVNEDIGLARDRLAKSDTEHAGRDRPHLACELRQSLHRLRATLDRRTVFRSEEHTSELQTLMRTSYAALF